MAASALALPSRLYAAEREATVSPNSKITAAIIGCGIRGKAHARELARLPECDIAYVCDPDLDRADEVGALLREKNLYDLVSEVVKSSSICCHILSVSTVLKPNFSAI